ncbi:hypothetical protein ACMD2_09972 [Ananas comosus]|uniref:Uncharacterized protein n=1 Tax=Ananas comosus TaxID=4615 RepID=A0A199WA73_ANACO|nr:hypothetical protein ACMD2_09972 [Ananas comosus]
MAGLESIGFAALGWVASHLAAKLLNEAFACLGIKAKKKLDVHLYGLGRLTCLIVELRRKLRTHIVHGLRTGDSTLPSRQRFTSVERLIHSDRHEGPTPLHCQNPHQ